MRRSRPPDAVVVLGAQVLPGGVPSTALARRVAHAVAALPPGVPLVVCGGVGGHPPAEAEVMAGVAIAAGVGPERIVREGRSRSTREQAAAVAALAADRGWGRVLLVTDRYHLPRARFLFRCAGLEVDGSGCGRAGGSRVRWWAGWLREGPAWGKALVEEAIAVLRRGR